MGVGHLRPIRGALSDWLAAEIKRPEMCHN